MGRHNVSSTEPSTMNSGVFGVLFTILGARVVSQDGKFFSDFNLKTCQVLGFFFFCSKLIITMGRSLQELSAALCVKFELRRS